MPSYLSREDVELLFLALSDFALVGELEDYGFAVLRPHQQPAHRSYAVIECCPPQPLRYPLLVHCDSPRTAQEAHRPLARYFAARPRENAVELRGPHHSGTTRV